MPTPTPAATRSSTAKPDQGGSQQPAEVDSGDATAVGSDDENVITQAADIVLTEGARANVVQVALILNIGVALANSGANIVGSTPGGSGTSGQIGTGDASATGLDIGQYITQAARENGDENTDAHATQITISLWMGVAGANSGTNVISGTGVAGSGGSVGSGNASATGNESLTEIEQYADILGVDQSTINVTQQATVLNVGFALANSGLNDVSGVASGLLTASEADDDAVAQELFAMLLPALLQSYGYGPAQGSIDTGNATAVGNDSETFIRQVAMAASSGDGQVDIVQNVLVANMGAAAANTGGNTLGNIRTLDPETANAVVTMAAFMSELLAQVHRSANDTAFEARSVGIEIPFQGLILRLDGAFEGLDTEVEQGGTRANVRQVSIVVSLGIAYANSGGNITSSETNQGNSVNGLQAGDALAVLALDADGNIIGTGDAAAGNNDIVVVSCQRINADDVDCLAPPTTTTPPATTTPATHDAVHDRSGSLGDEQHHANRLDGADDDGPGDRSGARRPQRLRPRSEGDAAGDRRRARGAAGDRGAHRPHRWCDTPSDSEEDLRVNIVLATLAMALSAAIATTEPPTTTPASAPSTTAAPSTAPLTTAPIPAGYVPLVDDTDSIVIAVPEAWTDVDTAPKAARRDSASVHRRFPRPRVLLDFVRHARRAVRRLPVHRRPADPYRTVRAPGRVRDARGQDLRRPVLRGCRADRHELRAQRHDVEHGGGKSGRRVVHGPPPGEDRQRRGVAQHSAHVQLSRVIAPGSERHDDDHYPGRDDDHYPGRDDNHGPSRNDDNRRLNLATDGCFGDGTVP